MLVVRRRAGEGIIVAGDVEISIVEISRTRVKLGITAPRNVSIIRREAIAVALENQLAAAFLAEGALDTGVLHLLGGNGRKIPQRTSGSADM